MPPHSPVDREGKEREMSKLRKPLWIMAIVMAASMVIGAAYEQIGRQIDARRSPEPGRLVNVGGHKWQISCTGDGQPTVILESGLGDILAEWQRVQAEISSFTRVCSYDRAGYGHSDAGPLPRTSLQISSELHDLLREAGERPPFILVGHSFGGYNLRVFNGHYPSEVAGMVLADAPQEDEYEVMPPAWRQFSTDLLDRWEGQARWMPLQITFGFARLRYGRLLGKDAYLILQSKYLQARASELKGIQASAAQARASGGLGSKPLIVLTAVKQDDALKSALSPDDFAHFQESWVRILQPRLAQLSSRGKQVILPDVGHDIPGEQPGAIVNAVREIYDKTHHVNSPTVSFFVPVHRQLLPGHFQSRVAPFDTLPNYELNPTDN